MSPFKKASSDQILTFILCFDRFYWLKKSQLQNQGNVVLNQMRTGGPRSCREYLYKHSPVCFFPGGPISGQFSKTSSHNTNLLDCYLFIYFKSEAFGLIPHQLHIGQGRLKLQTQHAIKIVRPPWLQVGTKKYWCQFSMCVLYSVLISPVAWLRISPCFWQFVPAARNSQFISALFLLHLEIN